MLNGERVVVNDALKSLGKSISYAYTTAKRTGETYQEIIDRCSGGVDAP
jgi:hypothetical protein